LTNLEQGNKYPHTNFLSLIEEVEVINLKLGGVMKRRDGIGILCSCLFVLLFGKLFAQLPSVATVEDFRAIEVNPAAMSFGNSAGAAFEWSSLKQEEEEYKIYAGNDNLGFIYGKSVQGNDYRVASSGKLFNNLYLGSDVHWFDKDFQRAKYGVSTLYRPNNWLCFGANFRDVGDSDSSTEFGVGIRPLYYRNRTLSNLEIAADASYNNKIKERWVAKPTLIVNTEPVRGLKIGGGYSFEKEQFTLGVSLAMGTFKSGGVHSNIADKELKGESYYLSFSQKEYGSILNFKVPKMIEYKQKIMVVDEKEQIKLGPFALIKGQTTVREIVSEIKRLKEDQGVEGILFKNPELSINFANLIELKEALDDFKESGKSIAVYSNNYGNLHYAFFASVADKLYLNKNGTVNLIGFSIATLYLSEMFEKLGVEIVDMKSHQHKTGLNIFTQSEMSDEEKEKYEEILEQYYNKMVEFIEEGRGDKLTSNIDDIINQGPYMLAEDALKAGLVDKIIYEDECGQELLSEFNLRVTKKTRYIEPINEDWYRQKSDKIAYINGVGDIVVGDGVPGRRIGSKTLSKQIAMARKNSAIKGIILRVDSGGGSAFASDVIAREIQKCKIQGKPVVVSMGSAAASGGYYIAAYADKILAEEITLTGSIGVTGMIPNFTRLFEKVAINWGSVKKGDNADFMAFYRPVEQRDIDLMHKFTLGVYDQFVNVVAEGRRMDYQSVHSIAQGQVWTGEKAVELNLVDGIGGIKEAQEEMMKLIGSDNLELIDYSYTYNKIPLLLKDDTFTKLSMPNIYLGKLEVFSSLLKKYSQWADEPVLMKAPDFMVVGTDR